MWRAMVDGRRAAGGGRRGTENRRDAHLAWRSILTIPSSVIRRPPSAAMLPPTLSPVIATRLGSSRSSRACSTAYSSDAYACSFCVGYWALGAFGLGGVAPSAVGAVVAAAIAAGRLRFDPLLASNRTLGVHGDTVLLLERVHQAVTGPEGRHPPEVDYRRTYVRRENRWQLVAAVIAVAPPQ